MSDTTSDELLQELADEWRRDSLEYDRVDGLGFLLAALNEAHALMLEHAMEHGELPEEDPDTAPPEVHMIPRDEYRERLMGHGNE